MLFQATQCVVLHHSSLRKWIHSSAGFTELENKTQWQEQPKTRGVQNGQGRERENSAWFVRRLYYTWSMTPSYAYLVFAITDFIIIHNFLQKCTNHILIKLYKTMELSCRSREKRWLQSQEARIQYNMFMHKQCELV